MQRFEPVSANEFVGLDVDVQVGGDLELPLVDGRRVDLSLPEPFVQFYGDLIGKDLHVVLGLGLQVHQQLRVGLVVVRLAHAVGEEKDAFFCLLVSLVVEQSDASANGPENIAALFFVVEPGVAHLVHSFEQNGGGFGDGVQL